MMEPLLISNILLWIAVLLLLIVVFALARQIGVLYERIAPAGALMMNQRLQVGMTAPQLALQDIDGRPLNVGGVDNDKKSLLIFFASPDCPVCNSLMPVLRSAAKAEAGWLRTILASDGEQQDHRAYIHAKGLEQFPYVISELLGKTYGVAKLPYAVLINEQGVIASMGIINSREHLESLFEAKEQRVASIQDYMQQRSETAQIREVNKS